MSNAKVLVRELLASTEAALERPPGQGQAWADRVALVDGAVRQLDEHGADGASLIRFGLAHLFAGPVLGAVVASVVLEARGEQLADEYAAIDLRAWRRALVGTGQHAPVADDFETVLRHASHLVEGWIAFAPMEALVRLAPFEPEQLSEWASTVDSGVREAADVYRWLVDRTLQRDLDEWSSASLKYEYRYATQGVSPHAPAALLDAPSPDRDALAHALAGYVLREDERLRDVGWAEFMAAVQEQAKMLLGQGRCAEAAALFEFLIGRYPSDPGLRNNLAFCLITSKPEEAYESLLEAQHLGYQPRSLLLYNRACCATLEVHKRDVLFEANRHWIDGLEPVPVGAYIWRRISDGSMVPAQCSDVRRSLAEIGLALTLELGDLDRVPVWEARVAQLSR
ncbi:hypothetical protein Q9R32_17430 [Actinotalea sp. AC32]|nr:hypothetical protein [Actinotalea sp. AC32]